MINSPPQDTGNFTSEPRSTCNFTSPRLRVSPGREVASTVEKKPAGLPSPSRVSHLEDALSVTSSNRNSEPRNMDSELETGRAGATGLEGAADSLENCLDDAFAELEEEMVPVGRTTSLLSLTTTTSHSSRGLLSSRAIQSHV